MSQSDDLARFRLPDETQQRLQYLLDRQDQGEPLTEEERREAEHLVNAADLFALFRRRMERLGDQDAPPESST